MAIEERFGKLLGHDNPRHSEVDRRYMQSYLRGALPYAIGGTIFTLVTIILVLTHTIDLSKLGKTSAEDLPDLQSRFGYVLKFSTPAVLFIFVCIHWVIHNRVRSPAMDPLYNQEKYITKSNNILQNTVEQFILSIVAQLILVTHLDAEHTLKYIPALSLLFIIGRITFWIGYPQYRSFGMITTMAPTMVVIAYNVYKFFNLYI